MPSTTYLFTFELTICSSFLLSIFSLSFVIRRMGETTKEEWRRRRNEKKKRLTVCFAADLKHASKIHFYFRRMKGDRRKPAPAMFFHWLFTLNYRRVLFNIFRWSSTNFRLRFSLPTSKCNCYYANLMKFETWTRALLVSDQISVAIFFWDVCHNLEVLHVQSIFFSLFEMSAKCFCMHNESVLTVEKGKRNVSLETEKSSEEWRGESETGRERHYFSIKTIYLFMLQTHNIYLPFY